MNTRRASTNWIFGWDRTRCDESFPGHVSTQHHHTFNVQIQPDLRSPLVQVNLRNNGITFSGVACWIPDARLASFPFLAYLKMQEDTCPNQHPSQRNRRKHLYSGQAHLRHYLGDDTSSRFLQRRHTDHDIRHSHLDRPEHTRPPHTVILYYR